MPKAKKSDTTSEAKVVSKPKPLAKTKLTVVPMPEAAQQFDVAAHYSEIAEQAYYVWQKRMGAPGSPEEDWLTAESIVRAAYAKPAKTKSTASRSKAAMAS